MKLNPSWVFLATVILAFIACNDDEPIVFPEINIISPPNNMRYDFIDTLPIVVELSSEKEMLEYGFRLKNIENDKVHMNYNREINDLFHAIDTFWLNTFEKYEELELLIRVKVDDKGTEVSKRTLVHIVNY